MSRRRAAGRQSWRGQRSLRQNIFITKAGTARVNQVCAEGNGEMRRLGSCSTWCGRACRRKIVGIPIPGGPTLCTVSWKGKATGCLRGVQTPSPWRAEPRRVAAGPDVQGGRAERWGDRQEDEQDSRLWMPGYRGNTSIAKPQFGLENSITWGKEWL